MTPPLPQPASGSVPRAEGRRESAPVASTGPFVVNLCSSTTPMALEQPKSGDLKQFTFFVSRRREDGRERFRLHMGYFDTFEAAEEWCAVVRDIYPGAWAGDAPGKRLREREPAAAVTPPPPPPRVTAPPLKTPVVEVSISPAPKVSVPKGAAPAASAIVAKPNVAKPNGPTKASVPAKAPASTSGIVSSGMTGKFAAPVFNNTKAAGSTQNTSTSGTYRSPTATPAAATSGSMVAKPPLAAPAASAIIAKPSEALPLPAFTVSRLDSAKAAASSAQSSASLSAQLPATAPASARSALEAASAVAQAAVTSIAPPPVLVVPTLQAADPSIPAGLSIPTLAVPTTPAPSVVAQNAAKPAPIVVTPSSNVVAPAPMAASPARAPVANTVAPKVAPPAASAVVAPPMVATPVAATPVVSPPVAAKPPVPSAPIAKPPLPPQAAKPSVAAPAKAAQPTPPRKPAAPTKPLSNVREVLAALDETGQTRQMPAMPDSLPLAGISPGLPSPSMSDTQVLKMLENRRADGSNERSPEVDEQGISLLRPDDTGTVRALKEAVTNNSPVSFAVQLHWSVQPIDLAKVPPLAIFSAYTLYTVEGSREGRKWYGLRLGFFTDAISAKQVAYYVRSEFNSVAVVPVSPQERGRASEADKGAAAAAARTAPSAPPIKKPVVAKQDDEITLIDTMETPALPAPKVESTRKPMSRQQLANAAVAKVAAQKAQRSAAPPPPAPTRRSKTPGKVNARDRRGPQSLEETLEILGADQLEIDNGTGERINDSGVRHLKVTTTKNSPFSRLLVRLSERVSKN